MIYNHRGQVLRRTYDYAGNELDFAYDKRGNIIFSKTYDLVVMSYNVQWFTLRNANTVMQTEILRKYDADIIGFQEFSKSTSIPTIGRNLLTANGYAHTYLSNHYNFNGISAKEALSDVTDTDFTYEDDEKWSYQKGYYTIYGKRIAFFNTHLTWRNDAATIAGRAAQAAELLAEMNKEEYCIATGDFNVTSVDFASDDYIGTFKPFLDAGYNMANYTPEVGITKTYTNLSDPQSLDDFKSAPDNIITSSNIDIVSTVFDTTKLDYPDENYIDHIPVISYLKIN